MRLFAAFRAFFAVLAGKSIATLEAPVVEPPKALPAAPVDTAALERRGALQLLQILQREGRLCDFLAEPIDGYTDAQIGAAVRDVHRGLHRALNDHVPTEPVLAEQEGARVRVDAGFDPRRIRLTGNVVGEAPFSGTLRHHGWRVREVKLPTRTDGEQDLSVVAPAEVEL